MSKITVLIVDDHPLFRQGLKDVIESDPSFEVVGEAADGEVAIQAAYDLVPDVILMDINLPTINGLQVTRKIKSGGMSDAQVIAITGYDDAHQVFHALAAGVSAYCPKDVMPTTLKKIIHEVHAGFYVVDNRTMNYDELVVWLEEKLGTADVLNSGKDDLFIPLSARELEILRHVTYGMANKEIAYELGISHQTVKNHMTAILRKLQVEDRTQAAVKALRYGWVRLKSSPW